jgi:hypothetical protein
MKFLLDSIAQHTSELLLALIVAVVVIAAVAAILAKRLIRLQGRWRIMFEGSKGDNVERMLLTHLRDRMEIEGRLESIDRIVKELDVDMRTAKRYVGLVRYDAFEEVGGGQSFALAIYDDHGDGVIVTSVVGRNDCRVYAKPLVRGRSERNLSQEEQRAIKEAREAGPKSLLSP